MKFLKKVKLLKKERFIFEVDQENEIIKMDLNKNDNLFIRDYQSGTLEKATFNYGVKIYTKKELIEREAETVVSCYYAEFENALKNNNEWNESNLNIIIDSLIGRDAEQEKKAKKLCQQQIENRLLTKYNCITLGDSELIADRFYLMPE